MSQHNPLNRSRRSRTITERQLQEQATSVFDNLCLLNTALRGVATALDPSYLTQQDPSAIISENAIDSAKNSLDRLRKMLPEDLHFHLQNIRSTLDGVLHFARPDTAPSIQVAGTVTSAQIADVSAKLEDMRGTLTRSVPIPAYSDNVVTALTDLRNDIAYITRPVVAGMATALTALLRLDPDLLDETESTHYDRAVHLLEALQTGEPRIELSVADSLRTTIGQFSDHALRSELVFQAADSLGSRKPIAMAQDRFGRLSTLILLTDELMGREENAEIAALSQWTENPTESTQERAAHKRNLLIHLKSRAESSP